MFTWLNKQGVESSDGFVVQSTGRFTIEYREDAQVVTLQVEHGSYGGGPSVNIAADAFSRWDNLRSTIAPAKQTQMRENFVAAMKFQGVAVEP
jgi:hypothetical protein